MDDYRVQLRTTQLTAHYNTFLHTQVSHYIFYIYTGPRKGNPRRSTFTKIPASLLTPAPYSRQPGEGRGGGFHSLFPFFSPSFFSLHFLERRRGTLWARQSPIPPHIYIYIYLTFIYTYIYIISKKRTTRAKGNISTFYLLLLRIIF